MYMGERDYLAHRERSKASDWLPCGLGVRGKLSAVFRSFN